MANSGQILTRGVIALLYVAAQITLVLTASLRADGAFGFRMFNESSSVEAHLFREVDAPTGEGTIREAVHEGKWRAHDARGEWRRFSWYDRVKSGAIAGLDAKTHASYGAAAQVDRLHAALDDLAAHVPDDNETRALVLEIDVMKNGRPPTPVTFRAEVRH